MAARYRPYRSQRHVDLGTSTLAAISSAFDWSTARSSSNDLEKVETPSSSSTRGDVVEVDADPGEGVPGLGGLVDAHVDRAGQRAVVLERLDRARASC